MEKGNFGGRLVSGKRLSRSSDANDLTQCVNILPIAFLEDLQVSFCDNGTCHPTETAIAQADNANILEKIRQKLVRCNNRNRARLCWSHAHFSREDATVKNAVLFLIVKRIHRTELFSDLCVPFTCDDKYILCLTLKTKQASE
jgi:hypothetical protein